MNKEERDKESIPFFPTKRIKVDVQMSVLKSLTQWYEKNKKPVTYRDIGGVQASGANVSGALQFFSRVGWLLPEKRGEYIPCDDLIQYFLGFDPQSAGYRLAEKILTTPVGQKLSFLLSEKKTANEKDIIGYVGGQFSLKQVDRPGIQRLLDLLMSLGALEKTEDGIALIKRDRLGPPAKFQEHGKQAGDKKVFQKMEALGAQVGRADVIFGVFIDANTPEENIRKAVRTVLDEIKKVNGDEE